MKVKVTASQTVTLFETQCLSHPRIVLWKHCHTISQGFSFSDAKDLGKIQTGLPPVGMPNAGGMG